MPPFCSKPGVAVSLQHACVQNICLLLLALLFQIGYRFVLRQCLAPKPSSFLALHFQGLSHDSRCTPAKVEVSQELYLKGNQRGTPNIRDSLIGCVFSGRPRPPKNEEELSPKKTKKRKEEEGEEEEEASVVLSAFSFFCQLRLRGRAEKEPSVTRPPRVPRPMLVRGGQAAGLTAPERRYVLPEPRGPEIGR